MTKSIIILLFWPICLVHTVPIIKSDCNNFTTVILEAIGIDSENISNEKADHKLVKKSVSEPCLLNSQNGNLYCGDNENEINQQKSQYGKLGTRKIQDVHQKANEPNFLNELSPFNWNIGPWSSSYYQERMDENIFSDNSNEFPKVLETLKPVSPIRVLPPVHSTYMHRLHPFQKSIQPFSYDTLIKSHNTQWYPSTNTNIPRTVRSNRIHRSRNDDFLAELSHAAIMNNILPTMPVPFVRHADHSQMDRSNYSPEIPKLSSETMYAVYPNGIGNCAQPILFSCSPEITRGTLGLNIGHPQLVLPYRQQAKQVEKNNKPSNNIYNSKANMLRDTTLNAIKINVSDNKKSR